MTLDTSAVLAILLDEVERTEFVSLIEQAPRRLISTVSVLETAMVLEGRKGSEAGAALDLFLQRASIEMVAFDPEQLAVARTRLPAVWKGPSLGGTQLWGLRGVCARAMVRRAFAVQRG